MAARSVSSLTFFEPRRQRVAADAEDAAHTPHRSALLVGGQDLGAELFRVSAPAQAGVLPAVALAALAEVAQLAVRSMAVVEKASAAAVAARDRFAEHGLSLALQTRLNHYLILKYVRPLIGKLFNSYLPNDHFSCRCIITSHRINPKHIAAVT